MMTETRGFCPATLDDFSTIRAGGIPMVSARKGSAHIRPIRGGHNLNVTFHRPGMAREHPLTIPPRAPALTTNDRIREQQKRSPPDIKTRTFTNLPKGPFPRRLG